MSLRARTAALAAGAALAGCTVTVETPVPEQFLLPDREAFAVAAEHEVRSTSTLETAAFNALLKEARGEPWLEESMTVVERFAETRPYGITRNTRIHVSDHRTQSGSAPPHRWFHAVITHDGFEDDSVGGARDALWFDRDPDGGVRLVRALHAQLCRRPGAAFYSAEPCP